MSHFSLFAATLAVLILPYARADSYLMGGTEPVCWVTDLAGDGLAIMKNPCPEGVTFSFTQEPPTTMYDSETYSVQLKLIIDETKIAYTLSDTKIVPAECKKICDGCKDPCAVCPSGHQCGVEQDHLPHVNVHSCLQTSGACTPFIGNTPGLATHTAAQRHSFDKTGTAEFTIPVELDAARYMIIGHARFFAGKLKYDAAIGVPRVVTPAPFVSEEWEAGSEHYIVIFAGLAASLIFVAVITLRKDAALDVVLALLKDGVSLFFSLAFELLDIVSDAIVFIMLWNLPATSYSDDPTIAPTSNATKKKYMIWYGFFMMSGLLIFVVHTINNSRYIVRMFSTATEDDLVLMKKSVLAREKKYRTVRKGALVNVAPEAANKQMSGVQTIYLVSQFLDEASQTLMLELEINRSMGLLALLIFEDLPMLCINIAYGNEHGTTLEIQLSTVITAMMVAFKISTVWTLKTLRADVWLHHKEANSLMVRLVALKEAKAQAL